MTHRYERYLRLYAALRLRTLARLAQHDSALACDMGMHLAHNWYVCEPGRNLAIELIVRTHGIMARKLSDRSEREYRRHVRATSPGSRISTVRGWEVA